MNKLRLRSISQYFDTQLVMTSLIALIFLLISLKVMAAPLLINGAGATFPEPLYSKWFSEYAKVDKDTTINYQGVGSGGGIRQLIAGTVDFGASDSPMTEEEVKTASKPVAHIPTILGAVVVSYNLKLDKPLKLTAETVAQIFNGKITKWNDEKIAKSNPGVKLPELPIVVATRSDGSGTTAVFTDFLSKVSKDWEGKASKTVDWFKGSVAAKGNAGVTGLIKQAEGTVGYIEYIYAVENKLPHAQIQNKKGEFIEASAKTISAASGGKVVADMLKNDFKLSITNSEIKGAYPVSSFTWLLVYEGTAKEKGEKLVKMMKWALSDSGQKMATDMNYAPLPKELRTKVLDRITKIKLN